MKQSDIFTLISIATIGVIASFFACNAIMGNPDEKSVSFKRPVETISNSVAEPDPEVFNVAAINPTIEVYVGDCEDTDQNGVLDNEELKACGREVEEGTGEESDENDSEANEDQGEGA